MIELLHTYRKKVRDPEGNEYTAVAHGQRRDDGKWEGWLEFRPTDLANPILRTERETTQSNKDSLVYWALGLEHSYLETALRMRTHRLKRPGKAQIV